MKIVCNVMLVTQTCVSSAIVNSDLVWCTRKKDKHQAVIMGLSTPGMLQLTPALTLDHPHLLSWVWPVQTSSNQLGLVSAHDK